MKSIQTLLRDTTTRLAGLLVMLSTATPLRAQDSAQDEGGEDWVFSYAIVGLSIGLGLFIICRMGKRSQEIKQLPP